MSIISRIKWVMVVILLNMPLPLLAAEAEATETIAITSEPTKCYEAVWGSDEKKKAGLGLNAGQAVTLCSGTTNAARVVECFLEAWAHPKNGGLGLTTGQAITLCKTNSLQ
ncbi:hypothetical protein SAMN05192566_0537 [Methylophilus rhizosphaerae]|uniref:Uncharacterized protein n=2 Tax=Methylophilus rhizosphaerae TaxID=492660 RepID=A0A1G8ZXT6_9PROT|nr:hypothetical protein SAMN05192566_0537 [Methylophilus rhizosphaerae]